MPRKPTPIQHYKKLAKKIIPKLGLKRKVRIKLADYPSFEIDKEKNLTINANKELQKREDAVFIHYLAHAKLLEEGMPELLSNYAFRKQQLMRMNKLSEKQFRELNIINNFQKNFGHIANRGNDMFHDFFVWQLVADRVGAKLFRIYIDSFIKYGQPESIGRLYEQITKIKKMRYLSYIRCIDNFVSFYVIAKILGFKKEADLISRRFHTLKKNKAFKKAMLPSAEEKVKKLRQFFMDVHKKFPHPYDFLKNKKTLKKIYREYLRLLYSKTGFKPTQIKFIDFSAPQ